MIWGLDWGQVGSANEIMYSYLSYTTEKIRQT